LCGIVCFCHFVSAVGVFVFYFSGLSVIPVLDIFTLFVFWVVRVYFCSPENKPLFHYLLSAPDSTHLDQS
jgi:hypothetical protein